MKSKAINKKDLLRDLPPEWPQELLSLIRQQVGASKRKIVVLDDDPTGTQTVHNTPVLTECSVEALESELQKDFPAFYILTNSRSLALPAARSLNAEIGSNLVEAGRRANRSFVVVCRSDSTLRGHFPGEVEALASGLGQHFDGWIVIPFFLEGGRYTVGDTHFVEEKGWLVPAAETEFAHRRGHHHGIVHEAGWSMRIGMMLASLSCLALGVLPTVVIQWMDPLAEMLVGGPIAASASGFGWMWLTPIAAERASYSAPVAFIGILSVVVVTYLLLHARPGALHRVPLWDCGFEKITSRMQYTATSFSMPIRRIFGFLFSIKEHAGQLPPISHPAFPQRLSYHLRVRDRFWMCMYQPVVDASFWLSPRIGRMQHGRIQIYLIYSFVTIIVLLLFL